jgi:polysaccharide export outer membrane protein
MPIVTPSADIPRELSKMSLPTYRIEPPDILLIDAVKIVPKAPYKLEPFDVLRISATGTLLDAPVDGVYAVDEQGNVDLGPIYGRLTVLDLTLDEAKDAIEAKLEEVVQQADVAVTIAQAAGQQQITGEHLVGVDGNVNLGTYGSVYITGMTLVEARQAIEEHLSEFLEDPEISVDILSYNSKVYYVIMQGLGAGFGDTVDRFFITGNETVLDAVSQVEGLQTYSSKRIWIARPAPNGTGKTQILPVDWHAVTQGASTHTNYQIMPGDRIFVSEDKFLTLDNFIIKSISPFERLFGFISLGSGTIQQLRFFSRGGNLGGFGNQGNFGGFGGF